MLQQKGECLEMKLYKAYLKEKHTGEQICTPIVLNSPESTGSLSSGLPTTTPPSSGDRDTLREELSDQEITLNLCLHL